MKLLAALAVIAIAGCTTTNSTAKGPNGRPLHYIRSPNPASAYKQASDLCPNGYNIISTDQQGLVVILTVECK